MAIATTPFDPAKHLADAEDRAALIADETGPSERTLREALRDRLEDAELNAIADARRGDAVVRVALDDL